MPSVTLLRSVSLIDGRKVDVQITGNTISAIENSPSPLTANDTYDLDGFILSVGFVEPHAHLDKAFLADRINNPEGDLLGAIRGLHDARASITVADTTERAVRAAKLMSQNGVTTIRTHADTTIDNGLLSIEALQQAKSLCSSFIDIQVAMLLEWPLSGRGSADRHALARDAIAYGVDVIGGCPHLDDNPKKAVEYLLTLAVESDLPLDLHADENLRVDSHDLEYLADIMLAENIHHHVNASHCVSLSTRNTADIQRIAEKVASAGITITALPQTNLFLQGRQQTQLMPRAITPIHELMAFGVIVAAGADNLQDPFNLMGRADPLEIASLLVTAAHLSVGEAFSCITQNAWSAVYGTTTEISTGQQANLVAVRATTLRESIAMGPPDRFVVYGGVVINEQIRNRK